MIQAGTNHSWVNNSDRPCRIAFMLLDAKQKPCFLMEIPR